VDRLVRLSCRPVVCQRYSDRRSLVSTAKGWFFVAVTSALLFVLISRLIGNYERTLHTVSQREAELQEAGQLLLEAQQTAGLGSYELDIASGRWRSSGICDQVLGIDEKFERTLETWQALVHPDDWPEVSAYFTETVLKAGSELDREYRIIRPNDGGCRWVKAMGSVDRDTQGQPQRLHGTLQDITAPKLSQAEIAETSSKLRATLNALPDLLFEVGKDGRIYQYHSHRSDLLAAPPEVFWAADSVKFCLPRPPVSVMTQLRRPTVGATRQANATAWNSHRALVGLSCL